jgi:hypothetical protein
LLAEGRAFASELQFLEQNSFSSSINHALINRDPAWLLTDISRSYNIHASAVSDAAFIEIVDIHMSQFPY